MRETARREIPKAMPQPIREPLKIATREELFEQCEQQLLKPCKNVKSYEENASHVKRDMPKLK